MNGQTDFADGGSIRPQRVLVTGGAGFIGANLVRFLEYRGHDLRVLDDLSTGSQDYLAGVRVTFIQGDVRDPETVRIAVEGCDTVVHLAAQTGVPMSLRDPRRDCDVNIGGTLNVLEACRLEQEARLQPIGFVLASSNAPLGRQEPPATEEKAPLPVSPYGASKLAGEGYALAYYGSWSVRTVALRFANVFGPWSQHKTSVVAKFFNDVLNGRNIAVDGDGEQTRDFVYVEDLCRAIALAIEKDVGGEVFQIATGRETSINELAELVRGVTGTDTQIVSAPPRQGDIRKNYSLVAKASTVLEWSPETTLEEGLKATWRWFRESS